MALSSGSWEAINNRLPRLYGELDRDKHVRVMLEVLNELVPAEAVVMQSADLRKPQDMSFIILPENHSTPQQAATIAKYSHQSPFSSYYLATWDAQWKMITDFMPLEDFYQTDLHRTGLSPLGIRHQIMGALGVLDGVGHAITVNRTSKAFTELDREILNVLQPHLVTSFINAAVYSRAKNSLQQIQAAMESAPGAYGCFDSEGKLLWIQEKAKIWLREFFGDETTDHNNLPRSLSQLLQQTIRKGNIPKPVEKVLGDECLRVCLGSPPIGSWVMRLERLPRTPISPFKPLPQFSQRKNEVLKWMVAGKTNAEIGMILELSPRTIEKHVHAILADFQVENRATAIVRTMEYCAATNGMANLAMAQSSHGAVVA